MGKMSTRSRKPPNRASSIFSIEPTASPFSRSSITSIRRAQCRARLPPRNSLSLTRPAPYARQVLTEDLLTNRTPEVHQWALEKFRKFRSDGQFIPFSVGTDTVVFPGFDGGAEWGGPAVDPETGLIYVNANDVAWTGALTPNTGENSAQGIYLSQCGVCHGEKMMGSPPAIPSLVGVGDRMAPQRDCSTIKNGKGRMPGFPNLI